MKRRMLKLSVCALLAVALLAALPGVAFAAPPVPGATPAPDSPAPAETPVTVEAAPGWGTPMTVRSWYGLRLREGPGLSEPVILVLRNGETVYPGAGPVWADGYSWTYVRVYRYGLFYEGFCATMYLSGGGGPAPVHGLKVVAPGGLRLRWSPGLGGAIYCVVPNGTILQPTGNAHAVADGYDWTEVTYQSYALWAATMYLVAV